jgi:hypothetical protein
MLRRRLLRHLNHPYSTVLHSTVLHSPARPAVFHRRPGVAFLPGRVWEN